ALVHGHRMVLHPPQEDLWVSRPLLHGDGYEPFESELLLGQLKPGSVVIDLGANIGYYTLLFARHVGPQGKVFAFEPDPANFALLKQTVEAHGYHNVVLIQKAASDRAGVARLHQSATNKGDHRLYDSSDGRPTVEVETISLDDFLADFAGTIDLIKMDIQGAEGLALEGMRQLLARQPDVTIATEFWPLGLRRSGSSAERFLTLLEESGFRFFGINERDRAALPVSAEVLRYIPEGEEVFTNILCLGRGEPKPPAALRPVVSLCLIVKNEENNIGDCLLSAQGLCDEIIVVDTGSTDRTKEIAIQHGARVFDFPWIDHFGAARNQTLEHATGQWIFWMDADDRLDEENREKLKKLFARLPDQNLAFNMKCRCQPEPGSDTATVVDHIRLFRNDPRIRWRYRVHEQILPAVRAA